MFYQSGEIVCRSTGTTMNKSPYTTAIFDIGLYYTHTLGFLTRQQAQQALVFCLQREYYLSFDEEVVDEFLMRLRPSVFRGAKQFEGSVYVCIDYSFFSQKQIHNDNLHLKFLGGLVIISNGPIYIMR
jgi:hypothetical protein